MDMKKFADRLSVCRQNSGMTQEEFASRIGVTPQAVSKWERGMSLPDTSILTDICQILNVSADELLQTGCRPWNERNSIVQQTEILQKLEITDPLQILLGVGLVTEFQKGFEPEHFHKLRLQLAGKGLLMPAVRIMDVNFIEEDSFAIRAYERILYEERLQMADENTADYICKKLQETVSDYQNYAYILNRDMVKLIVDRAKQFYPTLIEETVPARVSYRFLHQVMRELLLGGHGISNLNRIIETLDEHIEEKLTVKEIAELLI